MDTIEIICNIDHRFVKYCGVMLTSLFENNREEHFHIHIFATQLSEDDQHTLRDITERKYGQKLSFHFIGDELPDNLPAIVAGSHITAATYIRCFMMPHLPKDMHKALYLDCDMVVLGSVRPLWNMDISNYALAAVEDQTGDDPSHYSALDLKPTSLYFNAGMMLVNIDYWRTHDAQGKMAKCMADYRDRIVQHDQDVLNKVFEGKVLELPIRWNMQDFMVRRKLKTRRNTVAQRKLELPSTVIAHFNGRKKPWQEKCINPFKKEYERYLDMTQWKGERPATSMSFRLNRLTFPIAGLLGVKNTYVKIK